MLQMTWEEIKGRIYFEDGSLRDILISDWSVDDWKRWVDLVNSKCKLEFYNGQTKIASDKINFQVLKQYWGRKSDFINNATIYLNQIIIKCYFFDDMEFENDIQPVEFRSIEDHIKLMEYMADISNLNNKVVLLTEENSKDEVLLEVKGEYVKYHV